MCVRGWPFFAGLIPGSHRWGMHAGERDSNGNMRAYEDVEARAEAVPVPAKRGTAILFHNLVFHGSGQNLSDRVRWSLDWRYAPTLPPSGNRRTVAAEWWLESMSGKKNDYGPVAVRGEAGGIVPGWESWREKALAMHTETAGARNNLAISSARHCALSSIFSHTFHCMADWIAGRASRL